MALGMAYLHGRKVLHCDLKSSNVLIDLNWNVKLCDFGLSMIKSKLEKKKKKKGRIGTPHWMSPEILREKEYTEKSDVYSFGMIIWELLTGKIPYEGMSVAQIIGTVGYDEGHSLEMPDKGNPSLISLVKDCLNRNEASRPDFKTIVQRIQSAKKYGRANHRKVLKELLTFFQD